MSDPLVSVVIPTRNRPELAIRAIRSLLDCRTDDLEVIVLENSDNPSLSDSFATDSRVTVRAASTSLSMHDNWERGLDEARGDYIGYISDKDVFVPGGLVRLLSIVRSSRPGALNYRKATYCGERRKLFSLAREGTVTDVPTGPLLEAWFDQCQHLHNAPMIYNSLFLAERVNAIRRRAGRFFVGNSPDVCSGVLMAADTDHYTLVDEVLCLAHTGPWSNGYSSQERSAGRSVFDDFVRLYGRDRFDKRGLPICITSAIAETLLACREHHPVALGKWQVNWQRLVIGILEELDSLRCTRAERAEAIAVLRQPGSVVPPGAVRWGAIEQWLTHYDSNRPAVSQFVHRGMSFVTRSLFPRTRHAGPWSPTCGGVVQSVSTLDEALRLVAA